MEYSKDTMMLSVEIIDILTVFALIYKNNFLFGEWK